MTSTGMALRLSISAASIAGLAVLGSGLLKTVYFERTPEAVSDAHTGNLLVLLGSVLLLGAAGAAYTSGPRWTALAIGVPGVLCGGLALVAGGTLLPQLAALPAFPLGLAGAVGLLVRLPHG